MYTNPILRGDYSDPDVIRVGDDFYMIASSFTYLPGIPVLRSQNLIHWETIGYAAHRLPFARYDAPAHKRGTWAPSIRHHAGLFYVYVCLPDEGLLAFTAENPAGNWQCRHVKDVSGWIDPCPFWDDDGKAYLLHGFAASRCGINNILYLHEMSADGFSILDYGRLVYSGAEHGDTTVEGPKMEKRNGLYYIHCPAGGVQFGYQLALRAERPYGPYERKVVLSQGDTPVNGPHQGGIVDTKDGNSYFLHFQDMGVYGRVPHLQPVRWADGWPEMGENGHPVPGGGNPVPDARTTGNPDMSDDFRETLSLQWQWQANPNPEWFAMTDQGLRLFAFPADDLFHAGAFLSQLMQSFRFTMDVALAVSGGASDRAGIAMMGYRYGYLALQNGALVLMQGQTRETDRWTRETVTETEIARAAWPSSRVVMRMLVQNGRYRFFYGEHERNLTSIGGEMDMACGGWVGARPGIFCVSTNGEAGGYADFDHCRVCDLDLAGRA